MLLYEARAIFNLPTSYTKEDVTKTYRKLMMKWHPDVNKTKEAEQKAKQINEAKTILLKELESPKSTYYGYNRQTSNSSATNTYYEEMLRNKYVERLKKLIGNYYECELTPILSIIIDKANNIISEFLKIKVPNSYIYDIFSANMYNLFIEYAESFCNYYKLDIDWDEDAVFINKMCIIYKNKSLIDFAREINNKTYDIIYDNFYEQLRRFTGNDQYVNNLLKKVSFAKTYDKKFLALSVLILHKLMDFELQFKTNYHQNSNVKDLTDFFNEYHGYICSEILKYIKNYCEENGLKFSYDNSTDICTINGIEVSLNSNIFSIYNTLVSAKKLATLDLNNSKNDNEKIYIKHLK